MHYSRSMLTIFQQRKARYEAANKPQPTIAEPTPSQMAANFLTATSAWASAGFPVVTQAQYQARLAVCGQCVFWNPSARLGLGKCTQPHCGCTKFKLWMATEKCPIDKWPQLT